MACSKQMQREVKSGTWAAIFPSEQVTEQQSTLFVKKLLAVAVSNITYLRTIFPEHAFGDRCLEDLNLKILRDDSSCPGACQVIQWVKGCFDALDKKYLKMIIVGIYEDADDPDTIVESYSFKFSYSNGKNGATNGSVEIFRNGDSLASAHSTAETKKATIKLLRTIVVLTQTLKPLPDEVLMSMKLLYYDDVTPPDYQPPGFQHSDVCEYSFKQEPLNIKVGDVATPFHIVQLRIKTDASQFELKEEGHSIVQQKREGLACTTQMEDKLVDKLSPVLQEEEGLRDHVTSTGEDVAMEPAETAEQDDPPVCCPCGCNEDDGLMVLCAHCNTWQHAICYGLLSESLVPDQHTCDKCSDTDRPCTDPFLQYLSPVAIQATCLWRRTLLACTEVTRLLTTHLANRLGVAVDVARGLMTRLEKEGLIKTASKGKRLGKLINKEMVDHAMKKYFDRSNNSTIDAIDNKDDTLSQEEAVTVEQITQHTSRIDLQQQQPVKRVRSLVDETAEFELSCSQQDHVSIRDNDKRPVKKRKASVASKPIVV